MIGRSLRAMCRQAAVVKGVGDSGGVIDQSVASRLAAESD
jgi:hypothetical protein